MKNRITNNEGFTLIEMVMVIVILGILAAVAIPRFIDLKGSATSSVGHGITGALAGQITMLHANYLINSTSYTGTQVVDSIDSSNIDNLTIDAAQTQITGSVDGNNFVWTYTARSGFTAAQVAEDTGF